MQVLAESASARLRRTEPPQTFPSSPDDHDAREKGRRQYQLQEANASNQYCTLPPSMMGVPLLSTSQTAVNESTHWRIRPAGLVGFADAHDAIARDCG